MFLHVTPLPYYYRVSSADIDGTRYAKGSVLVAFDDDIPVFGKILDVICVENKCMFVCIPYVGDTFYKHFNAYEVTQSTTHYIFCQQNELADYHLLSLCQSFSGSHKWYISLKHNVQ